MPAGGRRVWALHSSHESKSWANVAAAEIMSRRLLHVRFPLDRDTAFVQGR